MSKALGIAEERLARGEISEDEFNTILLALQGGDRQSRTTAVPLPDVIVQSVVRADTSDHSSAERSSGVPPDMVTHYDNANYSRRLSGSAGLIDWFTSVTVLMYCAVFAILFLNKDNPAAMNEWLAIFGPDTSDDETVLIITLLMAIPELVVVVAGMVWIYRATRNLFFLRISYLAISPSWSVWWFFIPVAFLWMPVKVMQQIYAATMYEHNWRKHSNSGRIVWWWITFWVAGLLAMGVPSRLSEGNDESTTLVVYGIYCVISVVSILLFAGIVKDVTKKQSSDIGAGEGY